VEDDGLVLGTGDWATVITLTIAKPGMMRLGLPDGRAVEVAQGAVRIASTGTSFALEQVADTKDGVRLRTDDGLYLRASGPGASIALTANADANTVFRFARTEQNRALWAADEGYPFDEIHSTHLWIFNRAKDRILGQDSLGNGANVQRSYRSAPRDALRYWLSDARFVQAVMQGIYDADNTGMTDKDTSGFIFSAHFWNHERNTGGFWDPNPKINAFEYGTWYFRESLKDESPESCGRKLGLAIHYLEDLTQPMHCGLYLNIPQGLAITLEILGGPPAWLLGQKLFSADGNYRHENYEQWALRNQHGWTLTADDLNGTELDVAIFAEPGSDSWGEYWRLAGRRGLAEFKTWLPDDMSPIGDKVPFKDGVRADFAGRWDPGARKMVKLAQRLVINLLLSWAALSKLAAKAPRVALQWKTIAASQQGGARGAQLWGVDRNGLLRATYQETRGGGWTTWSGDWNGASPRNVVALAAAGQNDGRVALWALTPDGALHCNYQTSPGGDWHGWIGPGWNGAPKLTLICACQHGGKSGAQLWGVDEKGLLRSAYQISAGGGWVEWTGEWNGASPRNAIALAAAQENDGRGVALWAVTPDGAIKRNVLPVPGGQWTGWL
jgi:hypothetical protein